MVNFVWAQARCPEDNIKQPYAVCPHYNCDWDMDPAIITECRIHEKLYPGHYVSYVKWVVNKGNAS